MDVEEEELSEEQLAEQRHWKQGFLRFDGSNVRARNYAGFIQYEGETLHIWPKIFANAQGDPKEHRTLWFQHMIYWLSYCRRIRFPFSKVDFRSVDCENMLEAFIYIFSNYTAEVLSLQPYQCYEEVTEETGYVRGRIAINAYIRHDLATGNHHQLHCTHEPFTYNNRFNQVVKHTARLLADVTSNPLNHHKLQSILFILDEADDRPCSYEDCDKVILTPLFDDHRAVLDMCRMFLAGHTIDPLHGKNSSFCFLIPMEYVFEDFVFGKLQEQFPGIKFEDQSVHHLAKNERGQAAFQMKNDIYVPGKGIIIDTKYKARNRRERKKGVEHSDMYQVLSYAVKRGAEMVLLVYPAMFDEDPAADEFYIDGAGLKGTVHVWAVNLRITSRDIAHLDSLVNEELGVISLVPAAAGE